MNLPRTRRLLATAALLTAAAPAALLLTGAPATAAPSLDVYAVKGSAAGVRVTVQTGYSFVVEPDAMLPRAAASIEADTVNALASPLDPGDSVDALPGLGLPVAEGDIENGAATPNPIPGPLAGQTPPPQFSQAVDSVVSAFASTFNPILIVPYEHAQVAYPNPSGEPEHAGFPVGSADAVPPDFPDLLGLLTAHSSLGAVSAGPGHGVADSGVGSAVAVPAVGLTIGRISSHVDVHGGNGATATSTVTTTLHDVDLAPNGTRLLHIGTLVLTAVTSRDPAQTHATSHTDMQASDVVVAGTEAARLDQNGLSLAGNQVLPNPAAQQVIGMVSKDCVPQQPVNVPSLGTLTSVPVMHIGMPTLQDQPTHNGNEDAVTMTGPTLCIASSAPIPNTIPPSVPTSPGQVGNQVGATPTIYTITLGSVTSSAYGVSFPSEGSAIGPFLPPLPETGTGTPPGGESTTTTVNGGSAAAPSPTTGGSHPGGLRGLLATLTGGILSPKAVVTVATLAEIALLSTLWLSYRVSTAPRPEDAAAATRMDLV